MRPCAALLPPQAVTTETPSRHIFVDELDALGRARSAHPMADGHDEKEQTLNQLLVELDGFDSASGLVLLGGRAAEKIVFGHLSAGAADDISCATEIARGIVMLCGMDPEHRLRQRPRCEV